MEEKEQSTMDERTLLINRFIGVSLVIVGIYGLFYAYKFYKNK